MRGVFIAFVMSFLAASIVPAGAQTNYQRLKSFGASDTGTHPRSGLLLGEGGVLYGTTLNGGTAKRGTVFRLNVDGSDYAVLHDFTGNSDGKNPGGALIRGQDGVLYGTTVYGGSNRCGTIFTLATNGTGYAVLRHFSSVDGQFPYSRLVQASNGVLYGTLSAGTPRVYRINTNGSGFTLVRTFAGSDGNNPSGLIFGHDGFLYGTTQKRSSATGGVFKLSLDGTLGFLTNLPTSGLRAHLNALRQGTNGVLYGTICYNSSAEAIFSVRTNGNGYTVLHTFLKDGVDGQNPDTQLLQGLDGAFYGTTVRGGTNGAGTIFKLDGGDYAIIYHFKTNGMDGRWPEDSLIQGSDGKLYGTTLRGSPRDEGTIYAINPDGNGYQQLHQFNSSGGEGQTPSGSLVADGAGELYGTTRRGGNGNSGTLFKIGLDGNSYSVLRHFGGLGDGQWPSGTLLRGQDGAWYGTTYSGGSNGFGTIYRIADDGNDYVQLHSFSGVTDGDVPYDALVQDSGGFLYGSTAAGGSHSAGTVFKLNTNGTSFQVLHTFMTNGVDGTVPAGELLLDGDTLYGVTESGGTNKAGSVFTLKTDGSVYTIVHHFATNGGDGIAPSGGLSPGGDGNLYGATHRGGVHGAGALFILKTNGSGYSLLHSFNPSLTNELTLARGAGRLVVAGSGTSFGTYYEGGENNGNGGFLYQIDTSDGDFNLIHGFGINPGDGRNPSGGGAFADGSWYGITEAGGEFGLGSIYGLIGSPTITSQPKDQIASAGDDVSFSVAATGGLADYQWYFNGVALIGATNFKLMLPSVQRTNAGMYYVTVSNLVGMAVSSNALLTVHVPTHLGTPQLLADGSLEVVSAYVDEWPLVAGDLGRFTAQVSSNLTDWVNLPGALAVTNGEMVLRDITASNSPVRFYRILEFP